ncbi:hypothetical protein NDU88_009110 [Pleurodeles waltl]|uniref:Uncharacterized protein n=1 Tax=Pleurodeles waltl TaxID=8319 RepID=A0AAV7RV62_PLEWA|nr:hypothetical protein NDU88_009110 [Pleurodeles waltl]
MSVPSRVPSSPAWYVRRSRTVVQCTYAQKIVPRIRQFPGAERVCGQRRGVWAGVWAAKELAAEVSGPPLSGPVESETARATPQRWAGRIRDVVRGKARGVTPALRDRRWGWPAPLPPPLPPRPISYPGGRRCSFVCAAGHPGGPDLSRVSAGAVAALWSTRCTAVTRRRAGVERVRQRVGAGEKDLPGPGTVAG